MEQIDWRGGAFPRPETPAREREPEVRQGLWLTTVFVLLVVLLVVRFVVPYLAEQIAYSIERGRQRAAHQEASQELAKAPFAGISRAYQLIAKKVSPSVVHINVRSAKAGMADEFSYLFRRRPMPRGQQGQGSGVIVDQQGYIVTNNHVVQGASDIEVALSDGRRTRAQVIGADPLTDIAILKISESGIVAAEWGDSTQAEVGAMVWALGSPFGLQSSITFGILSAKNRGAVAGTPYQDFLQTDAAVNPGNSGGPLVDAQGRVIGINTAIVGESYQGISFAVPSSVARSVYERLRNQGRVDRGWLGVQMTPVSDELATRLGSKAGAFVMAVVGNQKEPSPALAAGVRPGDVIVAWNHTKISSPTVLSRAVAQTQIGSSAKVTVNRDGEEVELVVTVGRRPS